MTKEELEEVFSKLPVGICVTFRRLKRDIEAAVINAQWLFDRIANGEVQEEINRNPAYIEQLKDYLELIRNNISNSKIQALHEVINSLFNEVDINHNISHEVKLAIKNDIADQQRHLIQKVDNANRNLVAIHQYIDRIPAAVVFGSAILFMAHRLISLVDLITSGPNLLLTMAVLKYMIGDSLDGEWVLPLAKESPGLTKSHPL